MDYSGFRRSDNVEDARNSPLSGVWDWFVKQGFPSPTEVGNVLSNQFNPIGSANADETDYTNPLAQDAGIGSLDRNLQNVQNTPTPYSVNDNTDWEGQNAPFNSPGQQGYQAPGSGDLVGDQSAFEQGAQPDIFSGGGDDDYTGADSYDDGGTVGDSNSDGVLDFGDTDPSDPLSMVHKAMDYSYKKYKINMDGDPGPARGGVLPTDDDADDQHGQTPSYESGGSVDENDVGDVDQALALNASDSGPGTPSRTDTEDTNKNKTRMQILMDQAGKGVSDEGEEATAADSQRGDTDKPINEQADEQDRQEHSLLGPEGPVVGAVKGAIKGAGEYISDSANKFAGAGKALIASYLSRKDAAPPQVAEAVRRSVATPDPDESVVRSIAEATKKYGPAAGSAMAQHYAKKYETYRAFASAALNGSGGKPGDINAAVQAANQMYANMPDGQKLQFLANPGGVSVTKNGKPAGNLSINQFNQFLKGPDGQFDMVYNNGAWLEKLQKSAGVNVTPYQMPAAGQSQRQAGGAPAQSGYQAQLAEFKQKHPYDIHGYKAGSPGYTDSGKGYDTPYGPDAQRLIDAGYDPKEVAKAFAATTALPGNAASAAKIVMERQADTEKNAATTAGKVGPAKINAKSRLQVAIQNGLNSQNVEAMRAAVSSGNAAAKNATEIVKTAADGLKTVDPALLKKAVAVLNNFGFNVPQAKQPAQMPGDQPNQKHINWLLANNNPKGIGYFDAKFGPGSAAKYLKSLASAGAPGQQPSGGAEAGDDDEDED